MAVAALIVSVAAILIAGVSVWYTRRQVLQQERLVDIESSRRTDELEARRRAEQESRQAFLRLHVQREPNEQGSIDEAAYRYALVVANEGPGDASDIEVEIVSAWNNPNGTRACFAQSGSRKQRVGTLHASNREVLALQDDSTVDFGDIGNCQVSWRDDSSADRYEVMLPARPNWP